MWCFFYWVWIFCLLCSWTRAWKTKTSIWTSISRYSSEVVDVLGMLCVCYFWWVFVWCCLMMFVWVLSIDKMNVNLSIVLYAFWVFSFKFSRGGSDEFYLSRVLNMCFCLCFFVFLVCFDIFLNILFVEFCDLCVLCVVFRVFFVDFSEF